MHEIRLAVLRSEGAVERSPLRDKASCRRSDDRSSSLLTIPVPREERRRSNQRSEDRYLDGPREGVVVFRRRRITVRLFNVSSRGLTIECGFKPRIGEALSLQVADQADLRATVRWIKDGQAGLELVDGASLDIPKETPR